MGKLNYSRKVYLFPGSKVELKIHTFCLGFLFSLMEHQTQYLDSDSHTHSDNLHWSRAGRAGQWPHTTQQCIVCSDKTNIVTFVTQLYLFATLCATCMKEGFVCFVSLIIYVLLNHVKRQIRS